MFEVATWNHAALLQGERTIVYQHDYPPYTEPHPQTCLTMNTYDHDWVEIELFTCLGIGLTNGHRNIHLGVQVVPGSAPEDISDEVFQAAFVPGVKVVTRDRQGCWQAVPLGSLLEARLDGCNFYEAADWAQAQGRHLALPAMITRSSLPGVRVAGLSDLWHPISMR
jgi:hypothetical protein